MRTSQYLLATLKEIPKNCETISHQLMLRAGLIRQSSSGIYIWLPTGLRVLHKIKNIIREEMIKINAMEISMPIVQPAKFWKESGRWSKYGMELLRFKNRYNQDFILSPTHEEIISALIHKEKIFQKKFPLNLYQINTKYRDEIRPRFGIIRTREFIMKDGYSFHINQESLKNTYSKMYDTYHTILNRMSVNFSVVQADPGKIGGILSHEFQAYSKYGEDKIAVPTVYSNYENKFNKSILHNIKSFKIKRANPSETMKSVNAPNIHSVSEFINYFNLSKNKIVKTIIIKNNNKNHIISPISHKFLGLVIRSDHKLNHKKIKMILKISSPVSFANFEEISKLTGTNPNLLGPINLSIPLIVDYNVAMMHDFIAGSNIYGKYFFGINWNRDIPLLKIADLCHAENYDTYQNNQDIFSIKNSIEVGHIFQLGQKYSKTFDPNISKNKNSIIHMGCYGIGLTRIVAVIIEQNYDNRGIIWPESIAPFKIAIIPIDIHRSEQVKNISEKIYLQILSIIGTNVLIDDRKEHPGVIFSDIDLIGIPHILIISENNLKYQEIEYKFRKTGIIKKIKLENLLLFLTKKIFVKQTHLYN